MPHTILIVDDDRDVVESMSYFLEVAGYAVEVAHDGREALAVLARLPAPSLILVDLIMPVMDGIELLGELRKRPALAAVPVVVVSAASTISAPPGVPVLPKPFSLDTFLSVVKAHCAGAG